MPRHLKYFLSALSGFMLIILCSGCLPATQYTVCHVGEVEGDSEIELLPVPNNTSETLILEINSPHNFRHQIDLQLNNSSELKQADVIDRIEETYDIRSGEQGQQTCLINAQVPPGVTVEYELEWKPIIAEGNIIEGTSCNGNNLGTYTVVIDYLCNIIGQEFSE